jgi:aminomethyltransferase
MAKRTPFYDWHLSVGAKIVDFAGWELPLHFSRGITQEHLQTRTSGSIFDVSHMGRFYLTGRDVPAFLDQVLTRRVSDLPVGQCRYSLCCNEAGGVLDDLMVGRESKQWLVVCNGSNREKIFKHFSAQRRALDLDFDLADQTESTAMVAIQGPKVVDRLAGMIPGNLKGMKRWGITTAGLLLIKFTLMRSGYTGEDGVEIIFPAKMAGMAMKVLGGKIGDPTATIQPAGLGARDTLRIEAALPLYGHELSEEIDPISAGLAWAVNLDKECIGAAALRKIAADGPSKRLVGLELDGKRIARQNAVITQDGSAVGAVTSGTLSPTLGKSIAMGYVAAAASTEGTSLAVQLGSAEVPARVVAMPFYKRSPG